MTSKRKIAADLAVAGASILGAGGMLISVFGVAAAEVAGFQMAWSDPALGEKIVYGCRNKLSPDLSLSDYVKAKVLFCTMSGGADFAVELRRPPVSTVAPHQAIPQTAP